MVYKFSGSNYDCVAATQTKKKTFHEETIVNTKYKTKEYSRQQRKPNII